MVKRLLDRFGVEYEVIDVTDDYDQRLKLQQQYNAMTVPVLVSDTDYMVGFNQSKLYRMIKS